MRIEAVKSLHAAHEPLVVLEGQSEDPGASRRWTSSTPACSGRSRTTTTVSSPRSRRSTRAPNARPRRGSSTTRRPAVAVGELGAEPHALEPARGGSTPPAGPLRTHATHVAHQGPPRSGDAAMCTESSRSASTVVSPHHVRSGVHTVLGRHGSGRRPAPRQELRATTWSRWSCAPPRRSTRGRRAPRERRSSVFPCQSGTSHALRRAGSAARPATSRDSNDTVPVAICTPRLSCSSHGRKLDSPVSRRHQAGPIGPGGHAVGLRCIEQDPTLTNQSRTTTLCTPGSTARPGQRETSGEATNPVPGFITSA